MSARVYESEGFEDSGFKIRARLAQDENDYVEQADIDTIDVTITDLSDDSTTLAGTLAKTDVIFDTLQSWGVDDTGYNFKHTVPASAVPNADRRYRCEYKFTPTDGEPFHLSHERKTGDLKRS